MRRSRAFPHSPSATPLLLFLLSMSLGCGGCNRNNGGPKTLPAVKKTPPRIPAEKPEGRFPLRVWNARFRLPPGAAVGEWVKHRHEESEPVKRSFTRRIAVVGKEEAGAWVEETTDRDGATIQVAMLVAPGGKVLKAFGAHPGQTAVALQLVEAEAFAPGPSRRAPAERIEVAAGVFTCTKALFEDEGEGTEWRAAAVPLGGLVKKVAEGSTVELVGFGKNARPEVKRS